MQLTKNNIQAILELLSKTDDPTLLDAWENLIGVILIKNPNLFEDYDKIIDSPLRKLLKRKAMENSLYGISQKRFGTKK